MSGNSAKPSLRVTAARRLRTCADWLSAVSPSTGQVSGGYSRQADGAGQPPGSSTRGVQRLARSIALIVICSYSAVQVIQQVSVYRSRVPVLCVGLLSVALLFILMAWVSFEGAERWPRWRRLAVLLAEGLVTYLPMIVLGQVWGSMAGFFAGSGLLLLSAWAGWAVFAGAFASIVITAAAWNLGIYTAAYLGLSTTVLGLVVFGLARLWHAIRYLDAARSELAQLAVVTERMRFARDLHDLLGYSLSAITLKAELTRRVVGSNPARARDELAEILDTARQALADVRLVASGYRSISLAKEASSVSLLLGAAGIDARVEISCGVLDEQIDTALATVLREAVTNLLRHSTARNCTVEAGIAGDKIRLLITNDGVPGPARVGRPGGGLENLSLRMTEIGGDVAARIRADGWFEILARAPLTRTPRDRVPRGR